MLQTPRLLLIAPPTMTRTPAFERAAALAHAMQLPLHIVAFNYLQALAIAGLFAPDQIDRAREGYLDTHRHWLTAQADSMNKHGLEVTSEVVWVHHPYEEILHFVNEMSLALIIKDAEDVPALKRVFFTPLDWQLLRDCPVPVHLVTDARHPLPRKVLAIVDVLRSEEQDLVFNDQIVEAAAKLASQCNAQLDLLHVYDHFKPGAPEFAAMLPERLAQRVLAWDRRRVATGKAPWALPLKIGTHSVLGMLALRGLAATKRLRPLGSRFQTEQALIDRWVDAVVRLSAMYAPLGHEVALCGRLIKGYGSTNERGKDNLLHIIDHLALPALDDPFTAEQRCKAVAAARQAALSDEAGKALDQALRQHGAPARPVKVQPIRWQHNPRLKVKAAARS